MTSIKAFEFADFFQQDWPKWKFVKLNDAAARIERKILAEMAVAAGNVTKMPILWDKDDYKFLSQFPENKWSQAISWRYNAGLLEAAQIREEAKEQGLSWEDALKQVPEERDSLEFKEKGKTYVFKNVWTGLRSLIAKLEQPYRYHAGHNPAGLEPDKPGIQDIDPFETDETSPRHPKNYSGGLRNYDLSGPAYVDDSFIDEMIPDEEIELYGKPRTQENLAKARAAMKRQRQNSFAGMSVLQPGVTSSRMIGDWKRAAGYGLLGAPETYHDELTGETLPVSYETTEQVKKGRRAAGAKEAKLEPLTLGYITRTLDMDILDDEGRSLITRPEQRQVKIPVLPQAKLLPRIPDFDAKQREELAARRGMTVDQCDGYRQGMSYEEVEKICPELAKRGRFGQLSQLLMNYDLLTPQQREHLKKNQRDYLHLLQHRYGENRCPQCKGSGEFEGHTCPHCFGSGKDPYSQPSTRKGVVCPTCGGEKKIDGNPCPECKGRGIVATTSKGGHYVLGWSPNKRSRPIEAADMDKEALSAAITKWLPELKLEAADGIRMWINWAKRQGKIDPDVIQMVQSAFDPLVDVAALFAGLNLNHPTKGIFDPSSGLTNVIPKNYYALNTKDVNTIARALGDYDMPAKFWQRNNMGYTEDPEGRDKQTGTVNKKMNMTDAMRIAKELVKHENGQFPEKIASFSLDWIMSALAAAGLAPKQAKVKDEEDEEVDEEEGGDEGADDTKMGSTVDARSQHRINDAANLAADFSQRAFGSVGSKRYRQKFGSARKLTGGSGAEEEGRGGGGIEGLSADDDRRAGGSGNEWYTRRQQLRSGTNQINSTGWNVPKIGHEIDDFFDTYRDRILRRTTPQLAQQVTDAKEKAKITIMTKIKLMQQAAQEVLASQQNIDQAEFDKRVEELAMSRLGDTLKQEYPQMFKGDEDLSGALGTGEKPESIVPPDMQGEWDRQWTAGIQELINSGSFNPPTYDPPEIAPSENEFSLDMLARVDNKQVVDWLRDSWNEEGAKKWAVPLLMAVSKTKGQPLTKQAAIAAAVEAGVAPSASGMLSGKKAIPPALHAEYDEYMDDFIQNVIAGRAASTPEYNQGDEEITVNPDKKVSLSSFPATGGKPDAHYIVKWLEDIWDEQHATEHAVPLYMAVARRNGQNATERQAVSDILDAGIIPVQATPEDRVAQQRPDATQLRPGTQPAPATQPAQAATNVSALLADPVANYDQIRTMNRTELAAQKAALQQAVVALRQRIMQKRQAGQGMTPQERDALVGLGTLVNQL